MAQETRQQQIDKIWHDHRWLWFLPGLAVGLIIGLPIQLGDSPTGWFIDGIWPETLGILFTVFLIDQLNRTRDRQREERELQARLVRDAGSPDNATALNAVRELQARRWLYGEDGVLAGAYLVEADLKGARLWGANLADAFLWNSNLEEAKLGGANLEGADLSGANLARANLINARFNEKSRLPDFTNWTPGYDLNRFIDSNHPNFYQDPIWWTNKDEP